MRRCIQLAKNGLGTTYPNPLVGSIIVYENKIIGEGWHRQSGMPHAEVNAIDSVKNKQLLRNATIYINLEPCSHTGKTPPCANLIIEKQIKNVVIGCKDPNPKVAGNGIKLLKKSGLKVTYGILEKECEHLNKRFFSFFLKKRPYIILKWAESTDGFIAPLPNQRSETKPVFLSSKEDQVLVHQWRTQENGILVGAQTILADNPKLTSRWVKGNNPVRIALDPSGRIPINAHFFDETANSLQLTKKSLGMDEDCSPIQFLENSLIFLQQKGISSILVEGGTKTLQHFIDHNLWDEARIFISPLKLQDGISAPSITGKTLENVGNRYISLLPQPQKHP